MLGRKVYFLLKSLLLGSLGSNLTTSVGRGGGVNNEK